MKRSRRTSKTEVDLIGFLDILSAVMVIVLLVISVLALSIGEQAAVSAPPAPVPKPIAQPQPEVSVQSDVEIRTVGGRDITSSTAFLLCKSRIVQQFDPITKNQLRSWSLDVVTPQQIAVESGASNIYLAVAGSCFPNLSTLVQGLRGSGSQLGYEPVPEETVLPWQ